MLKQPSPSLPPPRPTLSPRPKVPPDLSLLCVGAVFRIQHVDTPCRVIAFDEIEVFYDVEWGESAGWGLDRNTARVCYYRQVTPLFLDGAQKLRVDPPSAAFLQRHRPDLPLRFGRSTAVQWRDTPFRHREEFAAYLESTDPALLQSPPLPIRQLALIPRSAKGTAWKKPIVVTAENGSTLTLLELLWAAHQQQPSSKVEPNGGVGFYRVGLEKTTIPSYVLGHFLDPSGALRWHAEAPPAS